MILKDILPAPAFREFVQCYRIIHFEVGNATTILYKAYPPKPEECLHFFLLGKELIGSIGSPTNDQLPIVLVGQQTSVMNRYPSGHLLNFTIVFQPAAIFRLTGISSAELTDKYVNAEYIFPKSIRFVFEQLQNAKSYNEMVLIADHFVMALIKNERKGTHLLDDISRRMIENSGSGTIDWLAKESCLSSKQFKRKFNERVGVNPKIYSRIIRFTKALNIKNAYPHIDWLRIAIECDYFDYQHLVRDYKYFTGQIPGEFHLLENNSPEKKLGLADEVYKSRARSSILSV